MADVMEHNNEIFGRLSGCMKGVTGGVVGSMTRTQKRMYSSCNIMSRESREERLIDVPIRHIFRDSLSISLSLPLLVFCFISW